MHAHPHIHTHILWTDLDEVLRWQGLKDRNEEVDGMLILAILALEQEVLMMQDDLAVHVLH